MFDASPKFGRLQSAFFSYPDHRWERNLLSSSNILRCITFVFLCLSELILNAILIILTYQSQHLHSHSQFNWWLPALPFSLLIFTYDETRKFLLRRNPGALLVLTFKKDKDSPGPADYMCMMEYMPIAHS